MKIEFAKYQGAGNDFILMDNRSGQINLSTEQIQWLCDRRFGVGADGLMYLESQEGFDFRMKYFNADGRQSTMCGNGGRCIVMYAHRLRCISEEKPIRFVAVDGVHEARILPEHIVALGMNDVDEILQNEDEFVLNTGSPHLVVPVEHVEEFDVVQEGRRLRHQQRFQPSGINVNFIEKAEGVLKVRTYERGVEDETLSCGTGVTAAAIASAAGNVGHFDIDVHTQGGLLRVSFEKEQEGKATKVVLTGPAHFVFSGQVELDK